MIEFSPLYTGKDSAVKMPELTQLNRAQERAQELNIKGEELKYKTALLDKETFMKQLSIDPVATVSNANMVKQAQKYDEFKNKWADRLTKSGGRLSDADKIQMEVDHNQLRGWQNQILANQARYLAALETKQRDTRNYYDPKVFELAQSKYLETGEFDPNILTVAPQDITAALSAYKVVGTPSRHVEINEEKDSRGVVTRWETQYPTLRSEDEAKQLIPQLAMSNEAYLKDLINKFDNAPMEEQAKYLESYDKNGDHIIDPQERANAFNGINVNHPIFEWAKNNPLILKAAMGAQPSSKSTQVKDQASKSGGAFSSIDIGMGTPVKYQPTERQSFKNYKTYHAVPEWPTQNIPANNITVQKPDGEKIKVADKTLSLQLTGYDEDTDEFTFITKGNYWSGNTMGAGDQIAISRSEVPPKFNDFEILVNGQKVRVKDVKRTAQVTEVKSNNPNKPSYPEWKKLNPNGTVADYNKL